MNEIQGRITAPFRVWPRVEKNRVLSVLIAVSILALLAVVALLGMMSTASAGTCDSRTPAHTISAYET